MSLFTLVLILGALGCGLFLLNKYAPVDGGMKKVINVVVIVAAVLISARAFGVCTSISNIAVPQVR